MAGNTDTNAGSYAGMLSPAAHVTPAQLKAAEGAHQDLLVNAAKVHGLIQFLNLGDIQQFERCLGRSGKSPECLSQAPDGGPKPQKYPQITPAAPTRKARQREAQRVAHVEQTRREAALLGPEVVLARLKQCFVAYSDSLLLARTGRHEMDVTGFLRLLRDCQLLDNKLTLTQADVVFTRVDMAADLAAIPQDLHIGFDEFLERLRALVRIKYPTPEALAAAASLSLQQQSAPAAGGPQLLFGAGAAQAAAPPPDLAYEALLALARKWLLPFARHPPTPGSVERLAGRDALFTRNNMNLLRSLDAQLKRLYAWYSTLEETDLQRACWAWVRDRNAPMNPSQFALMLLNFNVLPCVLTKSEAVQAIGHCEARCEGLERANNALLYPSFLEALAEVAVSVGDGAEMRMQNAASPDELKVLKRYADCCPPPHGPKMQQAHAEVLRARGRDGDSLKQLPSYDGQAVARTLEARSTDRARRKADAQALSVVERREELRQRFALTRLRNFYRDVRTTHNNSTWPPERDTSPTNRHASGNAAVGTDDSNDKVHVQFYDAERAIKTPKPLWLPVGTAAGPVPSAIQRRSSYTSGAPPPPWGLAADSPSAANAGGTMLHLANSNMLLIEHSAATMAPHAHAHGGGYSPRPPPVYSPSGVGYATAAQQLLQVQAQHRLPKAAKHYQMKVAIEDVDEREAILAFASKLPDIRPAPGRGLVTEGAAGLELLPSTSSAMSSPGGSQRRARAMTAPAALRAGRPQRMSSKVAAATAAAEAATAAQAAGGSPPPAEGGSHQQEAAAVADMARVAREPSGSGRLASDQERDSSPHSVRRPLPAITTHPTCDQARAVAMACLMGQGSMGMQVYEVASSHSITGSALGTMPSSHNLNPMLGNSSPSQTLMRGASFTNPLLLPRTTPSATAMHAYTYSQGPATGQAMTTSRARSPVRGVEKLLGHGLPHLPLPDDDPGVVVAAELADLDAFDKERLGKVLGGAEQRAAARGYQPWRQAVALEGG